MKPAADVLSPRLTRTTGVEALLDTVVAVSEMSVGGSAVTAAVVIPAPGGGCKGGRPALRSSLLE